MQEQKKKELEELNAMLAEMGVAPKEAEADAGGTAPSGKKKKKKDKAAVKENAATAVNGNGVAPNEQPKAEQPSSEETKESIEVLIALYASLPQQPVHAGRCCCAPASQVYSCHVLLKCCVMDSVQCRNILIRLSVSNGYLPRVLLTCRCSIPFCFTKLVGGIIPDVIYMSLPS